MTHDSACPAALVPAPAVEERHGVFFTAGRWTPDGLEALARHLAETGATALRRLPEERLLDAWSLAVERFRDPMSAESEAIRTSLGRFCALSHAGLDAALDTVLGGVGRPAARRLFAEARPRVRERVEPAGLVAVIVAGNLPALAVQPLLPALALRRPVLLKSPTAEPLFAPSFVRVLTQLEPALADAVAAVTWRGGDLALEAPVLARAATVLAYGDQETVDSVAARAAGRCVAYGPRTSLAVVDAGADVGSAAAGLARDIALFDQRGCLSVQAVYTDGDAVALAAALAVALHVVADAWPAGPLDPAAAAGVQQLRADARLRGLCQPELPLAVGTVVVDPLPEFRPSPGLRAVRVHPLDDLGSLPALLQPWRGRLQGAALAGEGAWRLESALGALGISRCATTGHLQSPDALWHNGGVHPLEALAGRSAAG
jgi:Acyl-CoA reductase (LuxC)